MRILLTHNSYLQRGGEDVAFEAEGALLRSRGHTVLDYSIHNVQISSMGRVSLVAKTLWNRDVSSEISQLIKWERPDIFHMHNSFPLLSPSAAAAARSNGIPVVQTLHNYRSVCPNAQLFRDGETCHLCVGRFAPWPGVVYRCYRQSRSASAVVAASVMEQRLLRRLGKAADVYVALTEDARRRFISAGIPPDRLTVKPNFLGSDPGIGNGAGGYAIFVGRLAPEKGVLTMLDAWSRLRVPLKFKIVGTGPLENEVRKAASDDSRIQFMGWRDRAEVLDLLRSAAVLVFPSQWYEGLPQAIVEALAVGTPVVASRLGAMSELIGDGETGFLFQPGRSDELANLMFLAYSQPLELARMRSNARRSFERSFTAERNYELLMSIYARARERRALTRATGETVSAAPTD